MSGTIKPLGKAQCEVKDGNMIDLPNDLGLIFQIYYQSKAGVMFALVLKSIVDKAELYFPHEIPQTVTVEYFTAEQVKEHSEELKR